MLRHLAIKLDLLFLENIPPPALALKTMLFFLFLDGADHSKAIRYCNKLWKKFTHQRTDANYVEYKKQRNKCTSITRRGIKEHFINKSETDNLHAFWKTYHHFMHSIEVK